MRATLITLTIFSAAKAFAQPYTISTFAGGAAPPLSAAALTVAVGAPSGVATDSAGNVYFASDSLNCVFRLDTSGMLTRVAGNSKAGSAGDGGAAASAQLWKPTGIALDGAGNLYIADSGNHRIRKVLTSGLIVTIAGNGTAGFGGDNGPATNASLGSADITVELGGLALPLVKQGTQYLMNPVDHRPIQRALLADLQAWIKDGVAPPPSVYPKISEGQLTPLAGLKFPAIDGVATPQHPRSARRLDFGPEFETQGIILQEPPQVTGAFPVLVPQTDADGIDLGGIRLPEAAVPLATLTGWNLRAPERGASTELAEFYGSAFPFAKTKEARAAANDPRPSIEERYASREDYLKRVNAAADDLIKRRFVLPQDRDFIVERAARLWDTVSH